MTTTQDDAKKKNVDDKNEIDMKNDDDELTQREDDDDETQKISKNETTRRETNVDEDFSRSRVSKKALSKRKRV
jgi:Ran GTPase-activating protein (RanGAP) involved in mRNA processing and transport